MEVATPQPFPVSPTIRVEPDPLTRRRKIHCKQELIVSSLQRFYAGRTDMAEILPVLQGTAEMSLRLIDWFVTNYAKANNTSYIHEGSEFLVYTNYKNQLKAYSKKLFDPFCRRERIYFQIPNHPPILTTVGKLNFFRWALEKGVLTYLKLNQAEIERDMNQNQKDIAEKRRSTPVTTSSSTDSKISAVSALTNGSSGSGGSGSSKSSTRRRLPKKDVMAAKQMQKHDLTIELRFD